MLQRLSAAGAKADISGPCDVDGPVLATLSSRNITLPGWDGRVVGSSLNGRFGASLDGIPVGGPYRLLLECCSEQIRINRLYVGDVWLLAGQSNMEGLGDMVGAAVPHPLVRVFSMRREWRLAKDPLHIPHESPDRCHAPNGQVSKVRGEELRAQARKGVGLGIFFAREMLARSRVPQGLIVTAHGATSMAQWSPAHRHLKGGSLYGSMLASVRATGQPIAGMLWHQGESDTHRDPAEVYGRRMRALVTAVRRDLGQPDLPWIMAQLAAVHGGWGGLEWNRIQEEQRLLPTRIRRLETIATVDLEMDDNLHLGHSGLPVLAARMARAADRLVLGNPREEPMPSLRKIVPPEEDQEDPCIDVVYDHVPGGLRAHGTPRGFALVDAKGRELPLIFKTTLRENTVRLHLHKNTFIPADTRLAYGHGQTPVCTIVDARGCALPVFAARSFLAPTIRMPFLTTWRVSEVVPHPPVNLRDMKRPDPERHNATTRTYKSDGFVNEHARWDGRSGHAYFQAMLALSEPMLLEFNLGYDGPFRLWINDQTAYSDHSGTGPCLPDEFSHRTMLAAGQHMLTVAMELGSTNPWGFFFRMQRRDLTAAQIRGGRFAMPAYVPVQADPLPVLEYAKN